jgi:hypothetical protein
MNNYVRPMAHEVDTLARRKVPACFPQDLEELLTKLKPAK